MSGVTPPGSETSLFRLYDAVPASEELDLAEEAYLERTRVNWELRYAAFFARLDARCATADDAEPPPQDPAEPLTHGQVLGMLEHLLGAHRIDD
jgi:hypothetical protein